MKNIESCVLCGSDDFEEIYPVRGNGDLVYFVAKCRNCQLLFLLGSFDEQEWNPDFTRWKIIIASLKNKGINVTPQKALVEYHKQREESFKRHSCLINEHKKEGGEILDVGCADGYFLTFFDENKWERWGIELNKALWRQCLKNGIEKVFLGKFQNFLTREKFDVVTMFHYLDHSEEPVLDLRKVYYLLKRRGILLIETFLANSFESEVFHGAPAHRFFFTKKTILKILKKAGLKNISFLNVVEGEELISLVAHK